MRTAIYVRVSTLEQAQEGYSIDEQIDKLKKYCAAKDWNVYQIYKDPGFTGSNTNRPGLNALISAAKRNLFDTVLVYKLDRLSRSQKDTLYLIEDVFGKMGISFVSLNENFDTSTPFGKAMIGILAVFAQLEREQIKERMSMGKLVRAKSGKAMAWNKSPFGYRYENGNYVIEPIEAQIVKRIFDEYLSGTSITKIRDHLNEEGHIGKKAEWPYRSIRSILDNATYAGFSKFKEELFEGNHEAIVTKEAYFTTQKELEIRQKEAYKKNNNPRPFQAKYMLSGLMRCGICGSTFEVNLRNVRKDGTRLKKYRCASHSSKRHNYTIKRNPNGCTSPTYDMEELENAILAQIEKLRINTDIIQEKSLTQSDVDTNSYEIKLKQLNSQLEKLIDLYLDMEIPKKTLEIRKKSIIHEIDSIETKLESLKENNNNQVSVKELMRELSNIKSSVYTLPYDQQKNLVRKLIKNIVVYPERMEVHWVFEK